ncbi:MAG TPA: hypothetical protein VMT03_25405 [Polyangia bacterium]|nr:hypothetical protein [Polyangia bacterium]
MLGFKEWGWSALLLALAAAGCGGNVTVAHGLGSREVLQLRDATISLSYVTDVEGQDPVLVYYTTQGGDAAGYDFWTLDLTTGAQQDLGGQGPVAGAQTSSGRYTCQLVPASDGTQTLQVTDRTTGVSTNVEGLAGYASCPGDDGTLSIFRFDPNNGQDQVLWSGPYQQLAMIQLPIEIQRVVIFTAGKAAGSDGGASVITGAVVVASVPGAPTTLGIYSISFSSFTVTSIVPATPASTAWAAGAPPGGSLESGSISLDVAVSPFNGHYVYARTMSDGGTTLFAGPFTSGPASELALFQLSSVSQPLLGQGVRVSPPDDSTSRVPVPAMASWQLDDQSGLAPSQMIVWDDTDARVAVCPSTTAALQAGVVSPDGTRVLFSAASSSNIRSFGPVQLVTMGPDGPQDCSQLVGDEVFWADFSGDGSMIAWISKTEVGSDTNLWIANGDGSGAQMLFTGTVYGARFITGTNKLELAYGGDLIWIDVQNPTQKTYVAEQLFGDPTSVGGSWFVGGYDYSTQDSSGALGAISLETGKKIQISPSVAQYLVAAQTVPNDGDTMAGTPVATTGVYHVAYLVRGRNPSSQDGIWVATVRAADLQ